MTRLSVCILLFFVWPANSFGQENGDFNKFVPVSSDEEVQIRLNGQGGVRIAAKRYLKADENPLVPRYLYFEGQTYEYMWSHYEFQDCVRGIRIDGYLPQEYVQNEGRDSPTGIARYAMKGNVWGWLLLRRRNHEEDHTSNYGIYDMDGDGIFETKLFVGEKYCCPEWTQK